MKFINAVYDFMLKCWVYYEVSIILIKNYFKKLKAKL